MRRPKKRAKRVGQNEKPKAMPSRKGARSSWRRAARRSRDLVARYPAEAQDAGQGEADDDHQRTERLARGHEDEDRHLGEACPDRNGE